MSSQQPASSHDLDLTECCAAVTFYHRRCHFLCPHEPVLFLWISFIGVEKSFLQPRTARPLPLLLIFLLSLLQITVKSSFGITWQVVCEVRMQFNASCSHQFGGEHNLVNKPTSPSSMKLAVFGWASLIPLFLSLFFCFPPDFLFSVHFNSSN